MARTESRAFDAMAAPPIPTGESAADVKNGSIGEFSASEESVMMPPYDSRHNNHSRQNPDELAFYRPFGYQ